MRSGFGALVAGIVFVWLAATLPAHHSGGRTYDLSRPITLAGVVSKTEWVNPHVQIYLDVTSANGVVTTWTLEGGAPNTLRQSGVDLGAIKQGERVTVDVWIARDGSPSASIRALRLSDGRVFGGPSTAR